jgi:hypothetical protein
VISAGVLTVQAYTIGRRILSVSSPQTRSLPGKLTGLRIQSLLSTEAKPEVRQDEPALEIKTTRKGGEVLSYRFSKPADPSYYALKRSDRDHYFKVAEYSVTPGGTVKLKERHGRLHRMWGYHGR